MPDPLPPFVIGFDSSGPACIVGSTDSRLPDLHMPMERGQAEHLLPLLERHLDALGRSWRDVAAIGVGIGPGNFTGVRIAVSAARGLALALGVPAFGISEFERLAADWRLLQSGAALLSLPAARGFVGLQRLDANGQFVGVPYLHALHAEAADRSAAREAAPDDPQGGAGLDPIFRSVVGYEAEAIATALGITQAALESRQPAGAAIAALALRKLQSGTPQPRPAPLYLRPADAAPASERPPVLIS